MRLDGETRGKKRSAEGAGSLVLFQVLYQTCFVRVSTLSALSVQEYLHAGSPNLFLNRVHKCFKSLPSPLQIPLGWCSMGKRNRVLYLESTETHKYSCERNIEVLGACI
jgi:hypothetical protein